MPDFKLTRVKSAQVAFYHFEVS